MYDFPLRPKITFYGFRNGPLLEARELPKVYAELARSPFVSLYGSLSWAEDWAELYAFWILKKRFGIEYKVELYRRGFRKQKQVYRPLRFPRVQKRLAALSSL